jgi:hypothetical protein
LPSLEQIVEGIYEALQPVAAELEGLQLYPYYVRNPTPPCIDVYPGDPFQAPAGFSAGRTIFFTVRARVSQADFESGQKLLLQLLDTESPASVEEALTADGLGLGVGVGFPPDGTPTGYRTYDDTQGGEFLGVEWRLEVLT